MDARTRRIRDAMSAGFPAVGDTVFDAAEARAVLAAAPAPDLPRPPVGRVEDHDADGVPVRVYRPLGTGSGGAAPPVVVFFHGGGFVLCGLDSHDGLVRELCAGSGAIVVSVDYRLAPEHRYPVAEDDAYTALVWVRDHAASFGGDPERIAVAGDSAGGNLAARAALRARDAGGPAVRHQLLVYPVTDAAMDTASYAEHAEDGFLTAKAMAWYWEQYLGGEPGRSASPLRAADLARLPSACVITAEYDPLRDEGEAYAAELEAAGVPVEAHRFDGAFHGFITLTHVLPAAREAVALACSVLRRELLR
ncbi:alpha/beta hydrolase [Actinocorallia populi]|uniref:alpha/beta hydrolase n=1 Tax=Actinocorallia populi TaxID=2079200 RepID=UPI000D095CD9|nr:alpha/beta hydrolase [Actinocorallia populi]